MDVNDSSDLESEIPVSVNLRKGEDATLSSLASSMTTENTVDEVVSPLSFSKSLVMCSYVPLITVLN
jgi:hypothetical protein